MQTVTANSSSGDIEDYQRYLARQGFYLGRIDGLWGPGTQRAHEMSDARKTAVNTPVAFENHPESAARLENIRREIISTAAHFVNLTEIAPNARWDDLSTAGLDPRGQELFEALVAAGWQRGWAYCAAFAEVTWRAGYKGMPELPLIAQSITPSAMGTFENFDRQHRIEKVPKPGALMIMQHGDTWQGHMGVVTGNDGSFFFNTIEGNTSPIANTREGGSKDGVYRKRHELDFTKKSGLWLRGFVNPFLI